MSQSLLRVGLRYWQRRRWQSVLAILGIALGVAVVVAIDIANDSARRAFGLSTEAVAGKATHVIVGGPLGLDADIYRRLRVEQGMRDAAPVVEGYATATELRRVPLRILGVDPFAEGPFRTYTAAQSNGPAIDLSRLFVEPGAALISAGFANAQGLKAGDTLTMRVGDTLRPLHIVGLLEPTDNVSARALDGLVITDISTAQETLGMVGKLSRVDLLIDTNTPAGAATLQAVQESLPQGVRVEAAQARSQALAQLTAAFELNLRALSLLALVVGMFLIYNTMTFSVIQRRPLIGTLRAMGVTRGEIGGLVLSEALVLSIVGGALGVLLGILLGRGAVRLVTQTITDLYFVVTVQGVEIAPLTLLKGVALGVGAALVAALAPAVEATSVPPRLALSRSDMEERVRRFLPWTVALAALLFIGAALLLGFGGRQLVFSFAGVMAVLLAMAALTPVVTVWLMRVARPVTGLAGVLGRIAPQTVTRALSRTSVAIAALMVAVSVTIGVGVMIASFRLTVEQWLGSTLRADVYVSTPSLSATRPTGQMDPTIARELAALPEVAEMEMVRAVSVDSPDGPASLLAVQGTHRRDASVYRTATGTPDAMWAQVQAGAALVSEPYAYRHNLTAKTWAQRNGEWVREDGVTLAQDSEASVTLRGDKGDLKVPVVGVYYDYASDQGVVMIALDTYRQWWNDPWISSIALYVKPGVSADALVGAIQSRYADRDLVVSANATLRRGALDVFDRTFAITSALQLLAMVVAFIGVLSALMALQLERTRELGTLRASGVTMPQMWGLTMLESSLIGGTAGLLAAPTGLALAAILVYVINLRSFGWTLQLIIPPHLFVQAFVVAVVAALLAGVYPAVRLGRMQIAEALRAE
ncbi:MAG: FtsX-like permease family protein [Anaerolineae bacterium]